MQAQNTTGMDTPPPHTSADLAGSGPGPHAQRMPADPPRVTGTSHVPQATAFPEVNRGPVESPLQSGDP